MINKKTLHVAVAVTLSCAAGTAFAALPANAILELDPQVEECPFGAGTAPACTYGDAFPTANYFAMDQNGNGFEDSERVGFDKGSDGGITLAGPQPNFGTDGPTSTVPPAPGDIPLEPGQIDGGWDFFSSHGWHITSAAPSIATDDGMGNVTLGMSGFVVHWNSGDIDMGAGADAVLTCANTCEENDTFTLDYNAIVPTGSFSNVPYALHMTGTIALPLATNDAPVANPDTKTVDRKATGRTYVPTVINVLANDTDANGISDIDATTVAIDPNGTDTTTGTIVVDPVTGDVTYTPVDDTTGTDTFTYTVTDKGGPEAPNNLLTSNAATVTITVQNAVPVAVNDSGNIDPSSATSVPIDVTANDTDSDGTIDKATVNIALANDASNGSTAIDAATGVVTYTPDANFIGVDTFEYTVMDNDGASSDSATVVVTVSSGAGVLPDDAFLIINAGTGVPGEGAYFSMEVNPGQLTATGITGFDHIQLGTAQPGSAAMPSIDEPWQFFGNAGVHQTTSSVTVITDDSAGNVTLDFAGWDVSWNSIASIPLGNGADNGIAALTCAVDCAIGDTFSLIYHATVPKGDPSSFGGVSYILHLDGVISDTAPSVGGGNEAAPYIVTDIQPMVAVDDSTSVSPNSVTVAPGTVATNASKTLGVNLTADDIGVKDPSLNVNDGEQCIGGCIDFIATGVTTDFIDLVFKLNKPLPDGAVFRKLINGKWDSYSTSGTDQLGTADADASGNCQGPEGKYNTGLRAGASCVFLRIYDGGPNDADGVKNGTIVDPSGALLAGSSNVPSSSTSGCSISNTSVDLSERADWMIVAAFLALMGMLKYRRRNNL